MLTPSPVTCLSFRDTGEVLTMPKTVTPLTHTGIQAARPAEKEYTLQDGNGLYLLIKPNGSKIWRFRYTRPGDGQRVLLSFGSLDEVTLADARKRRDEYRALLAKGTDPQAHQKQQTEAELMRRNNTFRKVAATGTR
ncbi:DUF4102 domain-containing protein [Salmonella enterica]|nr:DUF4102 domain-containing protein [Salmonella enterica]EEJ1462759.1 DUF4102 domain-containing protein [Salmonella enterica subsp. enterica serovar Virginia]EBD0388111.1 DUF4102 domain-containing protein [Salmonella enterica]ECQ3321966.1 DUF4102 domain-containing protein [Salmonella enterica]EEM9539983.1 DUF4102 domain-containing protein [Salmonella enterica]